jgi:hypothetical protein
MIEAGGTESQIPIILGVHDAFYPTARRIYIMLITGRLFQTIHPPQVVATSDRQRQDGSSCGTAIHRSRMPDLNVHGFSLLSPSTTPALSLSLALEKDLPPVPRLSLSCTFDTLD